MQFPLGLTIRERDVLQCTADGYTAEEIGKMLYLSPETVRSYRKRIIAKLDAKNSTHAVAIAFELGIVS